MHSYDVHVRRDGNWWMVEIPEITGLTQARRIGEVEEMARSLIAVSTHSRTEDVGIRITGIQVDTLGILLSPHGRSRNCGSEPEKSKARLPKRFGH